MEYFKSRFARPLQSKAYQSKGRIAGGSIGGGVGAWLGSSIGVAMLGTAFAGTALFAAIGAVIGVLLVPDLRRFFRRKDKGVNFDVEDN
ncbi:MULTISPECIES: hypothetical protein [unclassified Pseudovibrio]|uniref:hypothetical protein n=1 Tax=unclassified Pseudovibrio TaxID=2627060 RepID=UPI0007AEB961|nr:MULTISPECIES: hypothetical protein [unclassified Pseudovibrio]KZK97277.1 hypothetical protein PsW74_03717 [Pseudovibrio sp. W74]KZL08963.1 hypothetical protein PsAD14_02542 [Pseudovibrio sp. Ad14]